MIKFKTFHAITNDDLNVAFQANEWVAKHPYISVIDMSHNSQINALTMSVQESLCIMYDDWGEDVDD